MSDSRSKPKKSSSTQSASARGHSFAAKYERFLDDALALPAASVKPLALDPVVAMQNARRACQVLSPHRPALAAQLPAIAWDAAFSVVDLAEALVFAADRVVKSAVTREEIEAHRAKLQSVREPAILSARALALLGHLDPRDVDAIEQGTGLIDQGRDGVALAELFSRNANAIAERHPLTDAHLALLREEGEWVLRNVVPDGTEAVLDAKRAEAAEVRDRFGALLQQRYADLESGAFVLRSDLGERAIPTLFTRAAPAAKDEGEPKPVA